MPAGPPRSQPFLLFRAANPGPRKIDIIPDVRSSAPRHLRRLQVPGRRTGTGTPVASFRPLWRQQHQSVRDLRLRNPSCSRPHSGKGLGAPQLSSVILFVSLKHGAISRETEPLASNACSLALTEVSHTFQPPGKLPKQHNDHFEEPGETLGRRRPRQVRAHVLGKQVSANPNLYSSLAACQSRYFGRPGTWLPLQLGS